MLHEAISIAFDSADRRYKSNNVQVLLHLLIDLHHGGLVAAAIAVVRRGEDGHDIVVLTPVVTLHHELMSACDEREAVVVVELFRDVLAEGVAGTARRDSPAAAIIGVGPEKVAHGTLVGDLLQGARKVRESGAAK